MSIAEKIVEALLEGEVVRVCASCQKEFGTTPPPNASHGYCKRHALEMQQDLLDYSKQLNKPEFVQRAMQQIEQMKQRPESDFAPDMAHQHAAVAQ